MKSYYAICHSCNGTGRIWRNYPKSPYDNITTDATEICPVCNGTKQQLITEV